MGLETFSDKYLAPIAIINDPSEVTKMYRQKEQ